MMVMAFLGGCLVGLRIPKSVATAALLLGAVVLLNIIGWMAYGFVVNWQPAWGIGEVIGGIGLGCIGMLAYNTAPAVLGFGLTGGVNKIVALVKRRRAANQESGR